MFCFNGMLHIYMIALSKKLYLIQDPSIWTVTITRARKKIQNIESVHCSLYSILRMTVL